ncbi:transposable element Tcb1 transposase [Trichonephila clavipes]|nr:transposable element Tcb1 transposase [Trichonephila clavipes]
MLNNFRDAWNVHTPDSIIWGVINLLNRKELLVSKKESLPALTSSPSQKFSASSEQEFGSRVGRNQTTVMWICDHWMQEDTKDQRGRSHSPQCTTSRENRQIVHMAVTDRSVTSRTVAQNIESVTYHSVSAVTIRRRLQ